jgi:hypothetical protein
MISIKPGVRVLVTSQAILSSVTQHIQRELLNEGVLMDQIYNGNNLITKYDFRCIFLYMALFAAAAYGEYHYTNYIEPKLKDVERYSTVKQTANIVIFAMCIIFARGVETAT